MPRSRSCVRWCVQRVLATLAVGVAAGVLTTPARADDLLNGATQELAAATAPVVDASGDGVSVTIPATDPTGPGTTVSVDVPSTTVTVDPARPVATPPAPIAGPSPSLPSPALQAGRSAPAVAPRAVDQGPHTAQPLPVTRSSAPGVIPAKRARHVVFPVERRVTVAPAGSRRSAERPGRSRPTRSHTAHKALRVTAPSARAGRAAGRIIAQAPVSPWHDVAGAASGLPAGSAGGGAVVAALASLVLLILIAGTRRLPRRTPARRLFAPQLALERPG